MNNPESNQKGAVLTPKRPHNLPETIEIIDGRVPGNAFVSFEGLKVKLIYVALNSHKEQDTYPEHDHPFAELTYTLSGEGYIVDNGVETRLDEGTVFVSHPGHQHASRWESPLNEPWQTIIMQFDLNLDPSCFSPEKDLTLAQQLAPFYEYFFLNKKCFFVLDESTRVSVGKTIRHYLELLESHPDVGVAGIVSLWAEMVALVADNLKKSDTANGNNLVLKMNQKDRQLLLAKQFLGDEQLRHLPISEIAARVGISESHFIHEFHKAFGIPPQRYRQALVITRAAKLLEQTDLPVFQIAEQTGYSDSSAFNKSFKRLFGMSPQQYRNEKNRQVES